MATRGLVREVTKMMVKERLERETVVFDALWQSAEAQEIFRRFLQRAPVRPAAPPQPGAGAHSGEIPVARASASARTTPSGAS